MLVLELFREIFFEKFAETETEQELDPLAQDKGTDRFSNKQKAVLFALEGRTRQTSYTTAQPYYAPAYPSLAQFAWLRGRSERVVRRFLLRGPLLQHCRGVRKAEKNQEMEAAISLIYQGLHGHQPMPNESEEILSRCFEKMSPPGTLDEDRVKKRLRDEFLGHPDAVDQADTVFRCSEDDELARRIFHDFCAVCTLEKGYPRMQWIEVLLAFMRFALPMWMLAADEAHGPRRGLGIPGAGGESRTRICVEIEAKIRTRNRQLLMPTITPTRGGL